LISGKGKILRFQPLTSAKEGLVTTKACPLKLQLIYKGKRPRNGEAAELYVPKNHYSFSALTAIENSQIRPIPKGYLHNPSELLLAHEKQAV
jgi:hypothetical protein